MAQDFRISLGDYLQDTPGAVLLFVLNDARGQEINRQVVSFDDLTLSGEHTYNAKFIVDELLSAVMVPADYTLYLYVGLPSSSAKEPYAPTDYYFDKCLTEQGVRLRVRGGALGPSVGVHNG